MRLEGRHLPLEPADDEDDEGLAFPDGIRRIDREIASAIIDGKIEKSEAVTQHLTESLKVEEAPEDIHRQLLRKNTRYQGVCLFRLYHFTGRPIYLTFNTILVLGQGAAYAAYQPKVAGSRRPFRP